MNAPTVSATLADLPEAARLSGDLDVEALVADVDRITVSHWNDPAARPPGSSDTDWQALSLRSVGGDPAATGPGQPGLVDFADTPLAAHTPYLAAMLAGIPAKVHSARLTRLSPGGFFGEHRDRCGFHYGLVRLHIPITTDPGAVLIIDGQEHRWQPGTWWYGDFSRLHALRHDGVHDRIHLIVDVTVTPDLLDLFPASFRDAIPEWEVVFARPAVRQTEEELAMAECTMAMPASFVQFPQHLPPVETADVRADIRVADSGLVFYIDGDPAYGLTALGDGWYRMAAGTEERLLRLHTVNGQRTATFVLRHGSAERVVERSVDEAAL